jgi:tetratricopeptide (TPR) repeat protein
MINTPTLGAVYEAQGLKDDAIKIYKDILKKDPNNTESIAALKRLTGKNIKKNKNINSEMLAFFISMNSNIEYAEFERWLIFEQ